jgi:hypothetical protein
MYKSLLLVFLINSFIFSTVSFGQRNKQSASDKEYLIQKENRTIKSIKSSFKKSWGRTFINFTKNEFSLVSGINFSRQVIKTSNYNSNFNYLLSDFNKNVAKPGFYGGIRIDGMYKQKHSYSFLFTLNKLSTGTYYKDHKDIKPIVGEFSNFKGDEQFLTLNAASHLKKIIPIFNAAKYKLSIVAGPSFDLRLSEASIDNKVSSAYHKVFINGDIGLEFDNQQFYTLFIHYQQGLTSITKSPIKTNLNRFELGFMIKASDLF